MDSTAGPFRSGAHRFGPYEFDPGTGELRKQGTRLKLEGQPVAVLAMLLFRPGELVTREDLQTKLWPADTFVDFERSLNAAVRRLRVALNDSADGPRYIETLARRGYRFIAPVSRASAESGIAATSGPANPAANEQSGPRSRWFWLAVAGSLLAAALALASWRARQPPAATPPASASIHSIAVLPLENLTGDESQEYFADGMTEALITDLAQIGSLRVISRTSAMRYKRTHKPLPEIARELNVDGIVEGSVVRSGNHVRISSRLIHAPSDRHLWAKSYERDLSDIVALQGEVARAIAGEVQAAVTQEQRSRLATAHPVNREAYELFLQGQFYWNQWSPESAKKSIDCFQRAVQKDPSFAPAYAGLAIAYEINLFALQPRDSFPLAKGAAMKAVALDPLLADAHTALAMEKSYYEFDRLGAEREFLRAIELNPNSALAHRFYGAAYLKCVGRYQDALAEVKKAAELDPLSLPVLEFLALMYEFAGNYEYSEEQFHRVLQFDPRSGWAHLDLATLLARLGRFVEAITEFEKGEVLLGTPPDQAADRAAALRKAADRGKAGDYWRGHLALGLRVLGQPDQHWFGPMDIAEAYAQLGNKEKAFEWLERAFQKRDVIPLSALNCNPGFKNLHGDPRFADLLRRLNLKA